jgi:hypothetical protein
MFKLHPLSRFIPFQSFQISPTVRLIALLIHEDEQYEQFFQLLLPEHIHVAVVL